MLSILIIEDDFDIRELLQTYLEDAGYRTITAPDGEEAVSLFRASHVDLVLLDLMLPRLDGWQVCQIIRGESDVPIIMLTALDSEASQLKGFSLTIDDYVTKPFSIPVLLRKVEAVLRRTAGAAAVHTITYQDLTLDPEGYKVTVKGMPADLTQREFELLKTLLQNQGRVLTRQMLLNRIWSYDFYGTNALWTLTSKTSGKSCMWTILKLYEGWDTALIKTDSKHTPQPDC